MRIPSVFAIVLVGAVGIASAEPGRIRYGDAKAPDKSPDQTEDGWRQLATPTPAKHGTEFVVVGKELGPFGKLRIDADKATVIVRRVKVYFDDGKTYVVQIDKAIAPKKSAEIDLKTPGPIDHVVVTTEDGRGEYALYGSSPAPVAAR